MSASPLRKCLYRTARLKANLVLLLSFAFTAAANAQLGPVSKATTSSGPRATGVLQISKNGHAALIPIVIMVNGNFYDASIYRADPRPMALDPGIVYEAERSGKSLGLFTVAGAQQVNGNWYGTGQWRTTEELAKKASQPPPSAKKNEEVDQPPILRRPGASGSPPSSPAPAQAPAKAEPQPTQTPAPASAPLTVDEDTERPILRRGKPPAEAKADVPPEILSAAPSKATNSSAPKSAGNSSQLELVPAISDAHGPEPRPYSFNFKPGEEADYLRRVQALASAAVTKYEKARTDKFRAAELQPGIFHAYDLDLSNQPVFVFTAPVTVKITERPTTKTRTQGEGVDGATEEAYVCVVAKVGIYGDLRQLFAAVTDSRHLDEIPRLELIDAADVDGNGRGDLLFRETSDNGSGWVIYRVGPDKLIKIFDSAGPQE